MNKNKRLLLAGIMMLPIFAWGAVVVVYAVNIPWFDDFDPFPDFLRYWIDSNGSVTEALRLIFKPNNEHRMVFGKVLVLGYYLITGHLDFVFLQIAGACFTLGTCFILWRSFRESKINWWYFIPVPFLLFQFQYHMTFLWSICSLQHQPVVFFVCLSMFFLSREQLVWGVVGAVCATFAMSSGIFVWVGGAAILLLMSRFRHLAIWCVIAVISIGFYFYGMSAQGNESSLEFVIKNPHLSLFGFLAFLGGLFDLLPWLRIEMRSVMPVIASSLVLVWVVRWLLSLFIPWTKQYWKFPVRVPAFVNLFNSERKEGVSLSLFTLGVMVFLLSNAFAICILRPRFGFFVMLVSNYKLYPALFLSISYLAHLSATIGRAYQATRFMQVFLVSLVIWLFSAFNYLPTISERRKYLLVNGYNQEHNAFGLGHVPFSREARYVDELMNDLVKKGVYAYPAETSFLITEIKGAISVTPEKMGITVKLQNGQIEIHDASTRFNNGFPNGSYAFLANGKQSYLFKLNQNGYTGRNIFRQFINETNISIPLLSVLPGSYKLGVVKITDDDVMSGIVKNVDVP